MSRDQFSQLMLVYTGMAADIAEIFEVLTDEDGVLGFDKYSTFHVGGVPREQGDDQLRPDLRHPRRLELESAAVLPRHRGQPQGQEVLRVGRTVFILIL